MRKSQKIKTIDLDSEDLAKKLIEYKVPKREIAKIISSITKEKVNNCLLYTSPSPRDS